MVPHDSSNSSGDARAARGADARGGVSLGSIVAGAAIAVAGWALQRTVAHDARIAALSEGRDVAVVRTQLEAVEARLGRLEAGVDRILNQLEHR
jgi:hypothetical protein